MSNAYEMMVIFRHGLSSVQTTKILQEMEKILGSDAKLSEFQDYGKRLLAYPIRKQTEGDYRLYTFSSSGSTVGLLSDKLRLNEEILRFLIVKVVPVKKSGKVKKEE